jgi:endonuclease IV
MVGLHINKDGNEMHDAISQACDKFKIQTMQIFVMGPRNAHPSKMDYEKVNEIVNEKNIQLFVHTGYIGNIWTDKYFPNKIEEMRLTDLIGGKGLVIHIHSLPIEEVELSLNKFLGEMIKHNIKCNLIIEMSATKPTEHTYETAERINILIQTAIKVEQSHNVRNRIGICIDSSHIWAGGVDISSYELAQAYFNKLNHPERISLFHFNANIYDCSSGRDQHSQPFIKEDKIWGKYKDKHRNSGVRAIMEFCKLHQIPVICERHDKDGTDETLMYELDILEEL